MKDALAPGDRGRQSVTVEHVGSEQEQALRRSWDHVKQVLFSFQNILQNFLDFSSHQIL